MLIIVAIVKVRFFSINCFIFSVVLNHCENIFYLSSTNSFITAGRLDRITIQPGRTMKIIGTVLGPLKKYVGEILDALL